MAKAQDNKNVFSDFVKKAQAKLIRDKKHLTKDLIIPSLIDNDDENSGRITIRSLSAEEITECIDTEDDPKDLNSSDCYAVYLGVINPDLRAVAKELREAGNIDRPMDVVHTFEMHEITSIAHEIMVLSGVTSDKKVKVAESLKN